MSSVTSQHLLFLSPFSSPSLPLSVSKSELRRGEGDDGLTTSYSKGEERKGERGKKPLKSSDVGSHA